MAPFLLVGRVAGRCCALWPACGLLRWCTPAGSHFIGRTGRRRSGPLGMGSWGDKEEI